MRAASTVAPTSGDNRGKGCLLTMSTGQVITSAASPVTLLWDTESYDDMDFHSVSSNTGRITVPTGVTRIMLIGLVHWQNQGVTRIENSSMTKNGSLVHDGLPSASMRNIVTSSDPRNPLWTIQNVVAGDYFEIICRTDDASETLATNQTFFCATVVK